MAQRRTVRFSGILLLLGCVPALAQLTDFKGHKDPALFTRLPHYFLPAEDSYVETPFDGVEFSLPNGAQRVEGRHLRYSYDFDEAAGSHPGFLQIIRNYEAAAKSIGGKVLWDDQARQATLRIVKDGKETWVAVAAFNDGRNYTLDIIEKQAMQQDVIANAEALRGGLAQTGHVEVAGIFFDTAKSDVKPESAPALKEIVKLLQASPAMRLWVVGHTDSVGSAESNVALSNARAAAVIRALTEQMGVDPKRLASHGAGPFAPVASNKSEEGRAKNRRVELVDRP